MIVAGLLVEELAVGQRQDRAVAVGPEVDRDLRFALRRGAPGPAEHQPAIGHDLAIDAAHVVALAVADLELDPETAADADIDLGRARGRVVAHTPPLNHLLRQCPGTVNYFRRGLEAALEGKARRA